MSALNPKIQSGNLSPSYFDVLIIGSGVSGSTIAAQLTKESGLRVGMLEAGSFFDEKSFPQYKAEANTKLYWGGGMELTANGELALLRPRVVGGGSIVNQALVDRFDEEALKPWREQSGIAFLNNQELAPYYESAESQIQIQKIDVRHRNRNADIFEKGRAAHGYKTAELRRAQSNCEFEKGDDCIDCLFGCRKKSKQSSIFTTLKAAIGRGLHLMDRVEVLSFANDRDWIRVRVQKGPSKVVATLKARKLVMAAGSLGNTKILWKSLGPKKIPALGKGFYTHPQYMVLGVYDEVVDAFRGPFQSMKSEDPSFRKEGFKLENVFGPPAALAMLLPQLGRAHHERMQQLNKMACIEVAVRDTNPGTIQVSNSGKIIIQKKLNAEDEKRKNRGLEVIQNIFRATKAREIIPGQLPIGLHLMGGCRLGSSPQSSVVNERFQLWQDARVYMADSSVFPNAPGINPSLTIMALSMRAAEEIRRDLQ